MMAALALHEGLDANDTEKAGGGLWSGKRNNSLAGCEPRSQSTASGHLRRLGSKVNTLLRQAQALVNVRNEQMILFVLYFV
jgi:hypothetical protein